MLQSDAELEKNEVTCSMPQKDTRPELVEVHLVHAQSPVRRRIELPVDARRRHWAHVERAGEVRLEVRANGQLAQLDADHLVSLIVQPVSAFCAVKSKCAVCSNACKLQKSSTI